MAAAPAAMDLVTFREAMDGERKGIVCLRFEVKFARP
jgi:hypothetical protein